MLVGTSVLSRAPRVASSLTLPVTTCFRRSEWGRSKGITRPEIVAGVNAHAALEKAAHYFNVKLVYVPHDDQYQCVSAHPPAVPRRAPVACAHPDRSVSHCCDPCAA